MLQNYTMSMQKSILVNKKLFKILKKESWGMNITLLIHFLKYIIIMSGLKMKNWLVQLQKKSDKDEFVDLSDMPTLEGDEEVKKGKVLNF